MSRYRLLPTASHARGRCGLSVGIRTVVALALVGAGVPGLALGPLLPSTAEAKQEGGGKGNRGNSEGQRGSGRDADSAPDRSDDRGRGHGASADESNGKLAAGRARAQERYARAFGPKAVKPEAYSPGRGHDVKGPPDAAHEFSAAETSTLIERGWRGPKSFDDSFANHGQRVSTMVGIAKALGYNGRVGAMQANFGTPFENGIYDLEVSLADAQAQQSVAPDDTSVVAEIERLAADLAAAIGLAKPGAAPDDGWATVDLDVNDDLVVDQRDLQAAKAETAATDGEAQP